jgi:hypothetical protein
MSYTGMNGIVSYTGISKEGISLNEGGRIANFVWLFPFSFYFYFMGWRLFFGSRFIERFYFGKGCLCCPGLAVRAVRWHRQFK